MKQHMLSEGDEAPQFEAIDSTGKPVALSDHRDRFVLISFLRYSGCPWCNLTIHRLTREYPLLHKNDCAVIAVVQSTSEAITKNIHDRHKLQPQYPIIGDKQRKLYDMYGVRPSIKAAPKSLMEIPYWLKSVLVNGYTQRELTGNMLMVPAMFLVSPGDQTIVKAEYGTSFYDHGTFTGIYEQLTFR